MFYVNGTKTDFALVTVDASRYLDATLPSADCLDLEVLWK